MKEETKLTRNIIVVQVSLFAFQAAFFGILAAVFGYGPTVILLFYTTLFALHSVILIILLVRRDRFALEDGKPCTHVNLPNTLTLFRISSIPTVFFLLVDKPTPASLVVVIPFIAIVFITDFLDGILARSLCEITIIGKYLDSSSDYLLLFFTSIIFFVYKLIPIWFFILILVRLVFFTAGILLVSARKKSIVFTTSFLGKASVASTMILFVMELLRFLVIKMQALEIMFIAIEFFVGVIVLASLVEKAVILKREWGAKSISGR